MDAGLVIRVPESAALVSRWRMEHDPSARDGMPAHVTVLFPFKLFEQITAADRAVLATLFAAHEPFDLTFSGVGRFPNTLWLKPEPDAPFKALTRAVERAFPEYPIYGGAFDVIPHLTVAQRSDSVLDGIEADFRGQLVPFTSRAEAVTLFALDNGRWQAKIEFPLGQKA